MNYWKVLVTFCALLSWHAFLPNAKASQWDQKTVFTFSAPVEIPGQALPAGTYVFRLLDSQGDRHIVQIFNMDETQIYATILAVPDYRLAPTDKTVITFEERPSGTPEAIRAWFYPGENYGNVFVYPKSKAMELAKRTKQMILSMSDEMTAKTTMPMKSATEPDAMALKHTSVGGISPSGDDVEIQQVARTQPFDRR